MTDNTEVFTHEIRVHPSYDHRDEPGDNRGCGSASLELILHGPKGALSCQIFTDWMAHPLTEPYHRGQTTPRPRIDRPGLDARTTGHDGPSGAGVYSHSATQLKDYWLGPNACPILGGECYGDVGYLVSDHVLAAMVSEGDEGAWREMREIYDSWFSPDEDSHEEAVVETSHAD